MKPHEYKPRYDYKIRMYYCDICGLENCPFKDVGNSVSKRKEV